MFLTASLGRASLQFVKRGLYAAAATSAKMTEQKFTEHGVVPDVVAHSPPHLLEVKYASGVSPHLGNELHPRQVKDQPEVKWKAQSGELWTVMLTDPDAPSRKDPKNGEWLHWLVVNIPGDQVSQGEAIAEYVGSGPPEGSGLHRYCFLAYRQPGRIQPHQKHMSNRSADGRAKFHAKTFAKEHHLGEPVFGNFYHAQWDDYVPELYKQLGF